MSHQISSVTGYHPVTVQWYNHMVENKYLNYSNFVNLLNVKYILSEERLDRPGLRLVSGGDVKIYENTAVFPRAWVVYKTKVMEGKFFFVKQKTAYEIKECDWSSDVCSSDLRKPKIEMKPTIASPVSKMSIRTREYAPTDS